MDAVLEMARVAAMADFDRSRPLWEATLIEGLSDGGAALLLKLHHALTDGIEAVRMASILFDLKEGSRQLVGVPAMPPPTEEGTAAFLRGLAFDGARALASSLKLFVDGIRMPTATAANALSTVSSIFRTVRPITHAGSSIMRDRSSIRRLAVIQVSFDKLRRAGAIAGGSLNDAFIAATAAGMSRYHGKRGAAVDDFVVCMPISVRGPADSMGGNRATLMRFDVPPPTSTPRNASD